MVSVLRGGAGGCALVLCLSGLAALPGPKPEWTRDEQILRSAGIGVRPAELLAFLKLQILDPKSQTHAENLIGQLSHESFRVRESAASQLIHLGPSVLPLLEKAKSSGDLETSRRAERCAHSIVQANRPEVIAAAIRRLVLHRATGTTKALLEYLPAAANQEIAEQVCDAIRSISPGEKQCLEAALRSKVAAQRAIAGAILAECGSVRQLVLVKELLSDPEAMVRLRVAHSLLARADSDAVPALIALLGEAEAGAIAAEAEDILIGLAGETAPRKSEVRPGTQAVWQEWWRAHRTKLNLVDAAAASRQGPVARARSGAQQFLTALSRGDFPAFRRTVDIPFHLGGLVTFTVADDFDQLFRQVLVDREGDKKELSFHIVGMGGFTDFRENLGQLDLERLQNLDARKLHVVFVQGRFGGEELERGAVLVRLTASRALVIGIYQSPP